MVHSFERHRLDGRRFEIEIREASRHEGRKGTPIVEDVIEPGLAVVFCGTALGAASARRRAYYAGPGNKFWPTLAAVGLTPRRLEPEEYPRVTRVRASG